MPKSCEHRRGRMGARDAEGRRVQRENQTKATGRREAVGRGYNILEVSESQKGERVKISTERCLVGERLGGQHLDADRALLGRGGDATFEVGFAGPAPAERGLDNALAKAGEVYDELAREAKRVGDRRRAAAGRRREERPDEPAVRRCQREVALEVRRQPNVDRAGRAERRLERDVWQVIEDAERHVAQD